jgi:trk system potassium uptake protein
MNQRILANLGFLLQTAGLLTLLPIGVGFVFNETAELIPLFITCVMFLCGGFMLNALCERKDLNLKSSSALLLLAFIILPLIGAIPYIYTDPFTSTTIADRFTNGYFESVSGFTTTGFSFIANTEVLPQCILVYRSVTELMGGVGIVFLVLAFFQSKRALPTLGGTLGIENLDRNYRKSFISVLVIYSIYIIIFTVLFYALGYTNVVTMGTFVIDMMSGGFSPSPAQFQQYLSLIPEVLVILLMLLGSVNFAFNYHLLTGKIRKAFTLEIGVFIGIIIAASVAVALIANLNILDSTFHVVSMASTQGVYYLSFGGFNANVLSILTMVMLIGGCAFSMAGGIKVSRLLTVGEAAGHQMKMTFTRTKKTKKNNDSSEAFPALTAILLFIAVLAVFALLFSTIGISYQDALFEIGSALSTTGITMGAISVAMPLAYKWLIIASMTIGKVEILTIITILVPLTAKKIKRKTIA